ncbi:BREX-3 system phosphatase PglZ [Rhizobium leguminosarum]|uniref:BREX-3 system phosphatase PglZ n=1 Tax=Rhizobium TaxID=379 RepID=UPI0013B6B40F|nr:BREX-3 system phosphatase PglZ [Rhizobium leguminosarum]MBY5389638.1 BREX-3 system phosphatase PglZ [Rhizobium leguminosarum]MBY5433013.1 BREX-3 system phosphatase PglZ [Rhizobium leguminosarum]NEK44565.1 BREX-3 system phosphatase PglZ [Rhizobium leguminosarum]
MTAWSDHILAPFQREFSHLWVVTDPDEILLTPTVAPILAKRGFELVTYRDPLAFRHRYEAEIRDAAGGGAYIVHVRGDASTIVPWDVLNEARVHALSIPELFGSLDANAVRAVGSERYDDLWQITSSRPTMPTMGTRATKDFLAANLYRVVPDLLRRPADLWEQAFDIFFRGSPLPHLIACHVAERARRPDSMSVQVAASILSDRATFIDRVQRDWNLFARASARGEEPPADIIPFALPGIRVSLDSMVLDGTIAPAKVDQVPPSTPSWMLVGMVPDDEAARTLAEQRIDLLRQDIPKDGATHGDWLRFAERHAEIIDAGRSLVADATRPDPMAGIAPAIDVSLFDWLESSFDGLSFNSYATAPSIVHQIAPHMAHRRRSGERRQALIVVDGIALDQWLILERRLRVDQPDLLIDTRSCFAWLPTVTGVSRQAIFTGDQPRAFAKTIGSTSPEPAAWRRFWVNEGLAESQVFYAKGLGRPGSCDEVISGAIAGGVDVIGLVVDTVDELLHGELFGKQALVGRIEHWLGLGEWDRLVCSLVDAGYRIYVTADHGNVDVVGMGRPSEGSAAEERGERARIYDSEALRQKSSATIAGSRVLQPGGLPDTYKPLFAPHGRAFIPEGRRAVVHGGTSLEEVIVPFVRVSRKEKT